MTGDSGDARLRVLLVLGPHSFTGDLGAIGSEGETLLEALDVSLHRVQATTEQQVVEALAQPCDAIVLDPGSLEHFSTAVADVVDRLDVPVVVARDRQEHELGAIGGRRRVTPAATASVSGGAGIAYEAAVEAAARLAREARPSAAG